MSYITETAARVWASALHQGCWTTIDVAMDVERLRGAGWTIEPPPPRYYVVETPAFNYWVCDRQRRENDWAAMFKDESHPDSRHAAELEAARLNEQDQP